MGRFQSTRIGLTVNRMGFHLSLALRCTPPGQTVLTFLIGHLGVGMISLALQTVNIPAESSARSWRSWHDSGMAELINNDDIKAEDSSPSSPIVLFSKGETLSLGCHLERIQYKNNRL